MKVKIENFIKKHLISLNKKQQKDKDLNLPDLLNFIVLLDKELPFEDFFSHHGLELFNVIFKLTFYSHDFAVVNSLSHDQEEHDKNYLG